MVVPLAFALVAVTAFVLGKRRAHVADLNRREYAAQAATEVAMGSLSDHDALQPLLLLAQATALYPNQRTHLNLACALHARGSLTEAKHFYGLAGAPGSPDRSLAGASRLEMARIYLNERQWESAERYAGYALDWLPQSDRDDRADALIVRAGARWQAGNNDGAKDDIVAAIALEPRAELRAAADAVRMFVGMTRAAEGGIESLFQHFRAMDHVRRSTN